MEWTSTYIASQVLTVAMYAALAITYYLKDRRTILIINSLMCILIGAAYLLLSAYTGAAVSFVGIIRNIIFLINEKKNGKSDRISKNDIITLLIIYFATIVVIIPAYNGFLSLLSVFATLLYTFAVWQKRTDIYKVLGIPIRLLWIFYNIFVMSLLGIILESVVLLVTIHGFLIEWKDRKYRRQIPI